MQSIIEKSPGKNSCAMAIVAAALALCAGCTSTRVQMLEYNAGIASGDYAAAQRFAENCASSSDRDAVMWHLDAGSAADLRGDAKGALRNFDKAEEGFRAQNERLEAGRKMGQMASLLANDTLLRYESMGHEQIYCNLSKAIVYGSIGDNASALVEVNRAMQRQRDYMDTRRMEIERDVKMIEDEDSRIPDMDGSLYVGVLGACRVDEQVFANPLTQSASVYFNPYVLHFAGVFRTLYGVDGSAMLRQASEFFPGVAQFRADSDLAGDGAGLGGDWVWIYVEDGLGPFLDDASVDVNPILIALMGLGEPPAMPVISLPRMVERLPASASYSANGVQLERIADMDSVLGKEFSIRFKGILGREIARAVAKATAAVAADWATAPDYRDDNWGTQFAVHIMANFAMLCYQELSSEADLRIWSALPKSVFCARIARPESGVLELSNAGGQTYTASLPQGSSIVRYRFPTSGGGGAASVISFGRAK